MKQKGGREKKYKKELREAIQKAAASPNALHAFLQSILSPAEYRDIANRLQILKQLQQGKSQRSVAEDLGVGLATVERGIRVLTEKEASISKLIGPDF